MQKLRNLSSIHSRRSIWGGVRHSPPSPSFPLRLTRGRTILCANLKAITSQRKAATTTARFFYPHLVPCIGFLLLLIASCCSNFVLLYYAYKYKEQRCLKATHLYSVDECSVLLENNPRMFNYRRPHSELCTVIYHLVAEIVLKIAQIYIRIWVRVDVIEAPCFQCNV